MTDLNQDQSTVLSSVSDGDWVRIDDLREVTGIWRIHTIVGRMADQGLVEVQIRRTGNMVRIPRGRSGRPRS
jgi:hypothetical protein